ncbi:uncharacterized protein LOC112055156 [Bicyclus anynana]|uniref:Uncharacterized protein LOC112055156 n=1 Tax=Bicyclus anynana TaxID=110368 RepID=A0ABM3LVR4_BICAN|nr:uncharacterized protein LOC112055156 [Bicyclus anynana]XP_052743156.1 uncharacterized protein LOC112055156 [Bicyclus anynana]XP_052743157.1 uncharacterized protein LOC112055156 [Bicyclus anynana]
MAAQPPSMVLAYWTDKNLEEFSEELSKHKVLLHPVLKNKRIEGRSLAQLALAERYGFKELKDFVNIQRVVRRACLAKVRKLVVRYGVDDALQHAPFWLQRLNRPYELISTVMKTDRMKPTDKQKAVLFMWEMYACVRENARADGGKPSKPTVLFELASERGIPRLNVCDIWSRVYDSALARLRTSTQNGDLPCLERPSALEWRVIDLALLYEDERALSMNAFANTVETEALLLLYGLMSRTRRKRTHSAERRPPTRKCAPSVKASLEQNVRAESGQGTTNSSNATDGVEWESAEVWAAVTVTYCKSGREASLVTLQRRWYELLALARRALLRARRSLQTSSERAHKPHPLLLALAKLFPHVVTSPLPSWQALVQGGRIQIDPVVPSKNIPALDNAPCPSSLRDLTADLLEWSDDEPEIIENNPECIEINTDDEDTDNKIQNIKKSSPLKVIKTEPIENIDTTQIKQEDTAAYDSVQTQKPCIKIEKPSATIKTEPLYETAKAIFNSTLQLYIGKQDKQTGPKKKSRITFEDEDDLEEIFNLNNENLNVCIDNVKTEPNNRHDKKSSIKDATVSRISRNMRIKREKAQRAALSNDVHDNVGQFKKLSTDNYYKRVPRDAIQVANKYTHDEQRNAAALSTSEENSDSDGLCGDDEEVPDNVDEKLLQLSRVVLTPVEYLENWRLARGGTINCRGFSVKRFAAPVFVSPGELKTCRRYKRPVEFAASWPEVSTVCASREESFACIAQRVRDDIHSMPRELQMKRKRLTRRLRLPRTLPSGFWRSEHNMALLRECCGAPHVRLERLAARAVKRVELSDIEEVRRINRTILTAQVAPINVEKPNNESGADAADSGSEAAADDVEGLALEPTSPSELPNEKDLMAIIKTLMVGSIEKMTAATPPVADAPALRIPARDALQDDICRLLLPFDPTGKKSIKSCQVKPSHKRYQAVYEEEEPLPDALQEWHRQKNSVLRFFSFNQPDKQAQAKPKPRPKSRQIPTKGSENEIPNASVTDSPNNGEQQKTMDVNQVSTDALATCDARTPIIDNAADSPTSKRLKFDEDVIKTIALDKPLTVNLQEWQRQKNSILKYFNFKQPNKQAQPKSKPRPKSRQTPTKKSDNEIPNPSTDSPNNEEQQKSMDANEVRKAPAAAAAKNTAGSPTVKRLKLAEDIVKSIACNLRSTEYFDSDDDGRMIIDEGIEDCCVEDEAAAVPEPPADSAPSDSAPPYSAPAAPANITALPISSVPGLGSNHDAPANMVYVLKKNTDVPPHSSVALPGNASLTRNPPSTVLNTDLPMYFFIQKGSEPLKKFSEFKVHAGPSLKKILPKPSTVNANTLPGPSTSKTSTTTKFVRISKAGPLSFKRNLVQTLRKAIVNKAANNKIDSKVVEEIDLTDDTDENDASPERSSQSLGISSLLKIKEEKDVSEGGFSVTSDETPTESLATPTESSATPTESPVTPAPPATEQRMLCLEVGPIVTATEPSTDTEAQTICLDTDSSNESVPYVDAAAIKSEPAVDIDNSESTHIDKEILLSETAKAPKTNATLNNPPPTQGTKVDVLPETPSESTTTDKILPTGNSATSRTIRKYAPGPKSKKKALMNTPKKGDINKPTKITSTTTSKDLLKLSPEELARLLEDDDCTQIAPEPQVSSVTLKPIQVKKEKLWEDERAKDAQLPKVVSVKKEPGTDQDGDDVENFLADIPVVYDSRDAEPTVVNGDDTLFSLRDLGRGVVDAAEHAASVRPEEPLLKLDLSAPLYLLRGKYALLTDEDVPCEAPSFLCTTVPYNVVRMPESAGPRQELDLGSKKGRDVMVCGCNGKERCFLCESLDGEFEITKPKFNKVCRACGVDPKRERARLYNIKQRYYRKIADRPLKFVAVERTRRCDVCRDGPQFVARPDTVRVNGKRYERLTDEPLQYAPLLSVVPDAAAGARLARAAAEMQLLNVRTGQRQRVMYRDSPRHELLRAAVLAVMKRVDREEVDARYRRSIAGDNGDT